MKNSSVFCKATLTFQIWKIGKRARTPISHRDSTLPQPIMTPEPTWRYLEKRPHPWRRQLHIKGRRLTAFGIWMDMQVNEMMAAEAAENWDLPLAVIQEAIEYCETHRDLLEREAAEERRRLESKEIRLEPQVFA